jgi:hypothetical protein
MRFLIVRTDIRAIGDDELAAAWAQGECLRDEQNAPEPRRQVVRADDREAALHLARALASVGAVRAGRQRVKVLPIGEPERRRADQRDAAEPAAPTNGSTTHPPVVGTPSGNPFSPPEAPAPQPSHLGPQPGTPGSRLGLTT